MNHINKYKSYVIPVHTIIFSFALKRQSEKNKNMKTKIIIAFIVLITSAKAQDTIQYVSGPHGGLLKTVENYKIETINSYGCITAYLFESTLTVIPNKFISLETGLKNYQALKSGKVVPTILTLYRLSVFYNVTIEFLVHGQEYNQRKQIPEDSELIEKAKKILELNDQDKYIAMQVIDLIIYKQKYLEMAKRK